MTRLSLARSYEAAYDCIELKCEISDAVKQTQMPTLPALTVLVVEGTNPKGWCREGESNPQGPKPGGF